MDGVAEAVSAWLDAGEDPVIVRGPLTAGLGGVGPGEVLAVGPGGDLAGAVLGGAVDEIAWPLEAREPVTVVTTDDAGTPVGDAAEQLIARGRSGARLVNDDTVVEVYLPTTMVVVVGGGDLARALVAQAGLLGWHTAIVDDMGVSGSLLAALGVNDVRVVLSHDPLQDTPAIVAGLAAGVGYVGALGSRRTQRQRRDRLLAPGAIVAAVDTVRGPAGLDLGPTTASEIALSICAEVLALRRGRPPVPLHATTGAIHQ